MKLNGKTIYAQSSDIKSRTYLEYRKDMKKKAIVELEILEWLENKVKEMFPRKQVKVYKSGGDKFLWFLRKGGISREPDFIAEINGEQKEIEFQYVNVDFSSNFYFNFKTSKLIKKGQVKEVQFLCMLSGAPTKYAIVNGEWILKNSYQTTEAAWGSREVYRVDKEKMQREFKDDSKLKKIWENIDIKNFILNFQHELIDINREKLSILLQSVIDENKIVKIIPKNLESFFKVCFILDNLNKIPQNVNLWFVYLLSYVNKNIPLEDISKIVYCIDFLYSKTELHPNELTLLIKKVRELMQMIKEFYQNDGSYKSSIKASPIDETRYALFSINLLEDLIQDMIYYYSVTELKPVKKIYENLDNIKKTYELIKSAK